MASSDEEEPHNHKQRIRRQSAVKLGVNPRWVIRIVLITFCLTIVLSVASSRTLSTMGIVAAFFVLVTFILMGIVFDIVGVAVTSAKEVPFHSMSARKVPGAREAVLLIRNAEKVSNFCNDVVGDILNIVSGTTGAVIIAYLGGEGGTLRAVVTSLLVTACISSATVGGKAVGKTIAINQSGNIVFFVARLAAFFTARRGKKG